MTDNEDTFYKVTNKDIYQKLLDIERVTTRTQNMAKKSQIVSGTALTLTLIVLGYLISHIAKG